MRSRQAQRSGGMWMTRRGQIKRNFRLSPGSPFLIQHLKYSKVIFIPFASLEEAQKNHQSAYVCMSPREQNMVLRDFLEGKRCICKPQEDEWVSDMLLSKVKLYNKVKKARTWSWIQNSMIGPKIRGWKEVLSKQVENGRRQGVRKNPKEFNICDVFVL